MAEISNDILLCSQNPLLTKRLYGPLRDCGYRIEITEHTADAIKCVLVNNYLAVILDSTDVGLNVIEASAIIKNLNPDIRIFIIGDQGNIADVYSMTAFEDLDYLIECINNFSLLKVHAGS
jgi:DNA-binding NtrC family response regulator